MEKSERVCWHKKLLNGFVDAGKNCAIFGVQIFGKRLCATRSHLGRASHFCLLSQHDIFYEIKCKLPIDLTTFSSGSQRWEAALQAIQYTEPSDDTKCQFLISPLIFWATGPLSENTRGSNTVRFHFFYVWVVQRERIELTISFRWDEIEKIAKALQSFQNINICHRREANVQSNKLKAHAKKSSGAKSIRYAKLDLHHRSISVAFQINRADLHSSVGLTRRVELIRRASLA
jgi:hypothetical protein